MAERATIILKSQQEILDITGPGLLTDTYWDNYGMYTDITLLRNTDKRCRQPYTMKSHATLEIMQLICMPGHGEREFEFI